MVKLDPANKSSRLDHVSCVALLMIGAIDFYMRQPDEALLYRVKRGTALWNCLRDVHDWLSEPHEQASKSDLADARESFRRIFQAFVDDYAQMQLLCPGLGCTQEAPNRLAPLPVESNHILLHQLESLPVRWTLVQ